MQYYTIKVLKKFNLFLKIIYRYEYIQLQGTVFFLNKRELEKF